MLPTSGIGIAPPASPQRRKRSPGAHLTQPPQNADLRSPDDRAVEPLGDFDIEFGAGHNRTIFCIRLEPVHRDEVAAEQLLRQVELHFERRNDVVESTHLEGGDRPLFRTRSRTLPSTQNARSTRVGQVRLAEVCG